MGINPFHVLIRVDDQKLKVFFSNWFEPESFSMWEIELNSNFKEQAMQILQTIEEAVSKFDLGAAIQSLSSLSHEERDLFQDLRVIDLSNKDSASSKQVRRSWRELLKLFRMGIAYRPNAANVDRDQFMSPIIFKPSELEIMRKKMRQNHFPGFNINGMIDGIALVPRTPGLQKKFVKR